MRNKSNLKQEVNDGIVYFIDMGFVEDLTTDRKYYVKKFVEYIEHLEYKTKLLMKQTEHLKNKD